MITVFKLIYNLILILPPLRAAVAVIFLVASLLVQSSPLEVGLSLSLSRPASVRPSVLPPLAAGCNQEEGRDDVQVDVRTFLGCHHVKHAWTYDLRSLSPLLIRTRALEPPWPSHVT